MAPLSTIPFGQLLSDIAAKTPAPGGGAVASATGALAAALGSMVVSYSVGRKDLAAHADLLASAQKQLTRVRAVLLTLADEDAAAYTELNELQKLAPDHPRRLADYADAVTAAVGVPLAVMAAGSDMLRLLADLPGKTNKWLKSDLAIAAMLAETCVRAGACNVAINLPQVADSAQRAALHQQMTALQASAAQMQAAIVSQCAAE